MLSLAFAAASFADEVEQANDVHSLAENSDSPTRFETPETATRAGCVTAILKDASRPTCVWGHVIVDEDSGWRDVELVIFEADSSRRMNRTAVLRLPTHYGLDSMALHEAFADGRSLIFVEADGTTGTGLRQRILYGVGWFSGALRVVLAETVSLDRASDHVTLKARWDLDGAKNDSPQVRLSFSYRDSRGRESAWEEILTLDSATHFFRNVGAQGNERLDDVRARIRRARAQSAEVRLKDRKWLPPDSLLTLGDAL